MNRTLRVVLALFLNACGGPPQRPEPTEGAACKVEKDLSCMGHDRMICVSFVTWHTGDLSTLHFAPIPGQLTWVKFEENSPRCP